MKDETTQCDECGRHFYIGHAVCPECGTENPDYDYGDEESVNCNGGSNEDNGGKAVGETVFIRRVKNIEQEEKKHD